MKRYFLITLAVLIVAFGIGAGIALLESPAFVASQTDEKGLLKPAVDLPAFSLPDLAGNQRSSAEWDGKVRVVNFWATWCPPCRAETPDFIALQNSYGDQGVQFIGIAVDDKDAVSAFADEFGINYPTLLGDPSAMKLSKTLGNRFEGLPFTVVVDRDGYLRHRQPGAVPRQKLEQLIQSLL